MAKAAFDRVAMIALAIVSATALSNTAMAQSTDTRRIEELEKENAGLRARLRRLEAQSENTNLRAKIEKLEARRNTAPPRVEASAPSAPRLFESSAPDRTLILADMNVKAPPAIAPRLYTWTGVYVGVEGGYGWGKQDLNAVFLGDPNVPFPFPDVAVQSGRQKGWLLGGFAGAQQQWGSWVFGIEADFDAADIKNSAVASATNAFFIGGVPGIRCGANNTECLTRTVASDSKIDGLGSLRAKVGFAPVPNLLIYGTGGLGFGHVKNSFTVTDSTELGPNQVPVAPVVSVLTGGTSMLGWAAGAGVDWKWSADAGSAWVFGVEYLHYDFGTQTITVSNNAGSSSAFHTNVSADAIKGRISYLFSIH